MPGAEKGNRNCIDTHGRCRRVHARTQDLYRGMYNNPFEIPAATTTDADFFIPKKMKHFEPQVDIV